MGSYWPIKPGLFYTLTVIDPKNNTQEYNENNNIIIDSLVVLPFSYDLRVLDKAGYDKYIYTPKFENSLRIHTEGDSRRANYFDTLECNYYLSKDEIIDSLDIKLESVGEYLISPVEELSGVYYLAVEIDPQRKYLDPDRTNNKYFSSRYFATHLNARLFNFVQTERQSHFRTDDKQTRIKLKVTGDVKSPSIGARYLSWETYLSQDTVFDPFLDEKLQTETVYLHEKWKTFNDSTLLNVPINLQSDNTDLSLFAVLKVGSRVEEDDTDNILRIPLNYNFVDTYTFTEEEGAYYLRYTGIEDDYHTDQWISVNQYLSKDSILDDGDTHLAFNSVKYSNPEVKLTFDREVLSEVQDEYTTGEYYWIQKVGFRWAAYGEMKDTLASIVSKKILFPGYDESYIYFNVNHISDTIRSCNSSHTFKRDQKKKVVIGPDLSDKYVTISVIGDESVSSVTKWSQWDRNYSSMVKDKTVLATDINGYLKYSSSLADESTIHIGCVDELPLIKPSLENYSLRMHGRQVRVDFKMHFSTLVTDTITYRLYVSNDSIFNANALLVEQEVEDCFTCYYRDMRGYPDFNFTLPEQIDSTHYFGFLEIVPKNNSKFFDGQTVFRVEYNTPNAATVSDDDYIYLPQYVHVRKKLETRLSVNASVKSDALSCSLVNNKSGIAHTLDARFNESYDSLIFTIPSTVLVGEYNLTVNIAGEEPDRIKANNTSSMELIVDTTFYEYSISDFSIGNSTVINRNTRYINCKLHSLCSEDTEARLLLYFSKDSVLSFDEDSLSRTYDFYLFEDDVKHLGNFYEGIEKGIYIDSKWVGEWYLIAYLETGRKEADTLNNIAFQKLTILEKPEDVRDMAIDSVRFKSNEEWLGNSFSADIYVTNKGNVTLGTYINAYWSSDSIFDDSDLFLDNKLSENHYPSTHEKISIYGLDVPETIELGTWYVIMVSNIYKDNDSSNNVYAKAINVNLPNFIISNLHEAPDTLYRGDSLEYFIDVEIEGEGSRLDNSIYIREEAYLSADTIIDDSDSRFNRRVASVPDTIPGGDYYIIAHIKPLDIDADKDTTDNIVWKKVHIVEGPVDLAATMWVNGYGENEEYHSCSNISRESECEFVMLETLTLSVKLENKAVSRIYKPQIKGYLSLDDKLSDDDLLVCNYNNRICEYDDYYPYELESGNCYYLYEGDEKYVRLSVNVPSVDSVGYYYFITVAEPKDGLLHYDDFPEDNINAVRVKFINIKEYYFNSGELMKKLVSAGSGVWLKWYKYHGTPAFYLSKDNDLDTTDDNIYLGSTGDNFQREDSIFLTIPLSVEPGEYTFFARVNADKMQYEANMENNVFSTSITIDTAEIDLIPFNFHLEKDIYTDGEVVLLDGTVVNLENQIAEHAQTAVYLSNDSILDAGDSLIMTEHHLKIYSGGYSNFYERFEFDSTIPYGEYYLMIHTDYLDTLSEKNEANNFAMVPLTHVRPTTDLSISQLGSLGNTIGAGMSTKFGVKVENKGSVVSEGFSIYYYLSDNERLEQNSDSLIDSLTVEYGIGLYSSKWYHKTLDFPTKYSTGQYYLFAEIVPNVIVDGEINTNNVTSTSFSIIPEGIDLCISDSVKGHLKGYIGIGLEMSSYVLNAGGSTAMETTVGYYLSYDSLFDAKDQLLSEEVIEELKPNVYSFEQDFIESTEDFDEGEYYIFVKADNSNIIKELDETNNVLSLPVNFVIPAPDFVTVELVNMPPVTIVYPYKTIEINLEFDNQGYYRREYKMDVAFYLSADPYLGAEDQLLSIYDFKFPNIPKNSLKWGVQTNKNFTFNTPATLLTEGNYILTVLDASNDIDEEDETNNVIALPIILLDDGGGYIVETDLEMYDEFSLRVYPNPVTDYLFIENNNLEQSTVSLYSMQGELVAHVELLNGQDAVLDVSSRPQGNYILVIKHDGVQKASMIIKE